jgi:hypothetical protein
MHIHIRTPNFLYFAFLANICTKTALTKAVPVWGVERLGLGVSDRCFGQYCII